MFPRQVYYDLHPRLFNFLARLARRRDVAEDLLEETWLRVVRHLPRLRPDTQLTPWLFTIARNLYASYCRSRRLDYDLDVSDIRAATPSDPSPFEMAAAGQLQRRVEVALGSLPAHYREALLLVAAEGLTPSEAAVVCGVSPEALRQRLSRGRAMLAAKLESRPPDVVRVLNEVKP